MPKPKVYREYFPSCIERFFGSGKPRRIKARCFVPYTQQEQNTDVYLGPARDAPNIDLNMTVRKDKYGNLTCSPEGEAHGNSGSCHDRAQHMWNEDPCNQTGPCGPYAPCAPSVQSQRLDCGCSCRCSESCSTSSSRSSTRTSTTRTKTTTESKSKDGKPKILVLERDGRYRPLGEEFLKRPGTPKGVLKKSKSKSSKTSLEQPKLVVKEKKVEVLELKEKKVEVLEHTEDEVSILPAECGLDICTKDKSKNGVVLGYVMYDPESADKRPYVTTMDGKRITQDQRPS